MPAKSPATPYVNPAQTISDVMIDAAPDEITIAVGILPGVILGVATPLQLPIAYMPSFLIRITPATLVTETYALPPAFGGTPVAVYRAGSMLAVVNGRGEAIKIEE
jgi:hypothetical protein